MRIPRLVLLPLVSIVALAVLGVVFLSSQAIANGTASISPGAQAPIPVESNSGMPAISPKSNADIALSVNDVQTYIQTHDFMGGAVVSGHALQILSIQLMTPQQADAQGAELETYTTTTMVYVVKMEGPFYNTNVKTAVGGPSTSLVGVEIFDAHTGNMLEWDAMPSENDGI